MTRFVAPLASEFDLNGFPLSGAKFEFFEVGTVTKKNTFSDEALTTPNSNPVIADASGTFPDIFLNGDYDVTLKTSADVLVDGPNTIREFESVTNALLRIANIAIQEATTVTMAADTSKAYIVGDTVQTAEFTTGIEGGGIYDVVLTSSVTPNAYNIIIGSANTLISFVLRPGSQTSAFTEREWFVDTALGSDVFGKGVTAGAGAYKTIQFAIDSLPKILDANFPQFITCAAGTYNSSSRSAASLVRPSIVFLENNLTKGRVTRVSGRLTGPLVIRGDITDKTQVIIQASAGYTTAVFYNTGGQLGIDSMTIKGLAALTISELVISHRSESYILMNDIDLDGIAVADTAGGLVTESGGQIEISGTNTISNCREGAKTISPGDQITIAGDTIISNCTTGLLPFGGGTISWDITGTTGRIHTCTKAFNVQPGSYLSLRGVDTSTRLSIESPADALSCDVSAVFVDFESTIEINMTTLELNTCGHQNTLKAFPGSVVRYNSSNTFTTGNSENDSSAPIRMLPDAAIQLTGTNSFVRSGGSNFVVGQRLNTFSGNGQTLTVEEWDRFIEVRGSGANFTGLLLSTPTLLNQEVTLFGDSFNADFIDSTTASMATGGVPIGNSVGADYASITLKASDPDASGTLLWRESGRSALN